MQVGISEVAIARRFCCPAVAFCLQTDSRRLHQLVHSGQGQRYVILVDVAGCGHCVADPFPEPPDGLGLHRVLGHHTILHDRSLALAFALHGRLEEAVQLFRIVVLVRAGGFDEHVERILGLQGISDACASLALQHEVDGMTIGKLNCRENLAEFAAREREGPLHLFEAPAAKKCHIDSLRSRWHKQRQTCDDTQRPLRSDEELRQAVPGVVLAQRGQ
mmetsp:Transcript_95250/g.308491  ORF Transcript_95250/g.308491 Transcript_95250/m.308491 type:complete len:218 (-) Transcript_95250:798-1451(-)